MPEGDTIFRTAATLQRWLGGRQITSARTTAAGVAIGAVVGDRVAHVEPRAKHLLIRFSSGRVLHTHMRMTGAWHVYTAGERWKQPASRARLVLEAGDHVAVCFNAPVVELLAAGAERAHPSLASLGPDILADPVDLAAVVERAGRQPPGTAVGEVLLDQRVVSGIGNIYRSEALFVAGILPTRAVGSLADDEFAQVVTAAATLMKPRTALAAGPARRWVYRRSGRPCRRCGTPVVSARVGTQARTAYWCPRCQI